MGVKEPRITGHRINVPVWQRMAWMSEKLVAHYPQLARTGVYAALTCCRANNEDVDRDLAAGRLLFGAGQATPPAEQQQYVQ